MAPLLASARITSLTCRGLVSGFNDRAVIIEGSGGRFWFDRKLWPKSLTLAPGQKVNLLLPTSAVHFIKADQPAIKTTQIDWATGKPIKQ